MGMARTETYASSEQGRIGQILSSRPTDRRRFSKRPPASLNSRPRNVSPKPPRRRQADLARINDILKKSRAR